MCSCRTHVQLYLSIMTIRSYAIAEDETPAEAATQLSLSQP